MEPDLEVTVLDDSDRNIMWELRFDPCDLTDTCPSQYHYAACLHPDNLEHYDADTSADQEPSS